MDVKLVLSEAEAEGRPAGRGGGVPPPVPFAVEYAPELYEETEGETLTLWSAIEDRLLMGLCASIGGVESVGGGTSRSSSFALLSDGSNTSFFEPVLGEEAIVARFFFLSAFLSSFFSRFFSSFASFISSL